MFVDIADPSSSGTDKMLENRIDKNARAIFNIDLNLSYKSKLTRSRDLNDKLSAQAAPSFTCSLTLYCVANMDESVRQLDIGTLLHKPCNNDARRRWCLNVGSWLFNILNIFQYLIITQVMV